VKYKRQAAILRIVKEKKIRTHEQLIDELTEEGFKVTQATVSRDIKEMGIIKEPSDIGSIYAISIHSHPTHERKIRTIADSVIGIEAAMNMIVVKTHPGMASAIGASVDELLKEQFLGSIAGDDVLLVITKSIEEAQKLKNHMQKMFGYIE